jgi:hypothetical protein
VNHIEIPLTQGQVALVSTCDAERVEFIQWAAYRIAGKGQTGKTYLYGFKAGTKAGGKKLWMHNFIMQPGPGLEVDHINGNPLDNRRENLRVVTHAENCRNRGKRRGPSSSRYLGVYFTKRDKCWRASIGTNGARIHLGDFHLEEDAAMAYNEAAFLWWGPDAKQNEWRPQEGSNL